MVLGRRFKIVIVVVIIITIIIIGMLLGSLTPLRSSVCEQQQQLTCNL